MKPLRALFIVITLLILAEAVIAEQKDLKINVYLSEPVFVGREYNKLFKIENLNYLHGNRSAINVSVYYNITENRSIVKEDYFFLYELNKYKTAGTGNITFSHSGNYSVCGLIITSSVNDAHADNDFVCKKFYVYDTRRFLCNVSINVSTGKTFYNNSEQIKIYNKLNNDSFFYTIEYWIEDLFGTIIKEKYNTTNQNQKTYTPHIAELDRIYVVNNRIAELGCNNTAEKTADRKFIFILGADAELKSNNESNITIKSIKYKSGNSAKFGEIINAELELYKGNTLKKVVYVFIEDEKGKDVSQKTKLALSKKYSNHHITVPVQLKPNCNKNYENSSYILVVEGLGIEKRKTVRIGGITSSLCGTISSVSKDSKKLTEAELINYPREMENNKEFSIMISITNTKDEKKQYEVYSYVYRGSKSYSGEREKNLINIGLEPWETKNITQTLVVNETKPGSYMLKVRYKRQELKTWKSITETINVIGENSDIDINKICKSSEKQEKTETFLKSSGTNSSLNKAMKETTGNFAYDKIIYESPSAKAKKLSPYFVMCFLAMVSIFFVLKENRAIQKVL